MNAHQYTPKIEHKQNNFANLLTFPSTFNKLLTSPKGMQLPAKAESVQCMLEMKYYVKYTQVSHYRGIASS